VMLLEVKLGLVFIPFKSQCHYNHSLSGVYPTWPLFSMLCEVHGAGVSFGSTGWTNCASH
jgi:hypothetical protein